MLGYCHLLTLTPMRGALCFCPILQRILKGTASAGDTAGYDYHKCWVSSLIHIFYFSCTVGGLEMENTVANSSCMFPSLTGFLCFALLFYSSRGWTPNSSKVFLMDSEV